MPRFHPCAKPLPYNHSASLMKCAALLAICL
jgi:hypothetical protein